MSKLKQKAEMFSVVDELKAPIIHGHTCIELKDVRNGKRERIESDNTFMTTNLVDQFKAWGMMCNSPAIGDGFRQGNWLTNLCGGILLFKDEIPANSRFMNAGNVMTANGAYNVLNTSNPTELGSWNELESNITGTSAGTLVWDWDTSHGNGQVSSVCLTTRLGGYCGYGNASETRASSLWDVYNDGTPSSGTYYTPDSEVGYGKVLHGNYVYSVRIDTTTRMLTIGRYRAGLSQISLFQRRLKDVHQIDLAVLGLTTAPNGYRVQRVSDNMLCIWAIKTIPDSDPMDFYLVNLDNFSASQLIVYNTTGSTVNNTYAFYNPDDDFLGVYSSTDFSSRFDLYLMKASTGTVLHTFRMSEGLYDLPYRFAPKLYMVSSLSRIYDFENYTIYKSNAIDSGSQYHRQWVNEYKKCSYQYQDGLGVGWNNGNDLTMYNCNLRFSTINNLPETVTKTATQTMKVTYTLTEV